MSLAVSLWATLTHWENGKEGIWEGGNMGRRENGNLFIRIPFFREEKFCWDRIRKCRLLIIIDHLFVIHKLRKQIGNSHSQEGRLFSLGGDCQRWLWDSHNETLITCSCCTNVLHLRNIGKTKLLINKTIDERSFSKLVPKSFASNQNSKCQLLFFESHQVYN